MKRNKRAPVNRREFEQIVKMLSAGLSYAEVAEMMQVCEHTLKIYKKAETWENYLAIKQKKRERWHAQHAEKNRPAAAGSDRSEQKETPEKTGGKTVVGTILIERTEDREVITLSFDRVGILEGILRK